MDELTQLFYGRHILSRRKSFPSNMNNCFSHPALKPEQEGVNLLKGAEFGPKPLLTKREREVFELLVQDKTTRDIAKELFISEKTVRNHISNTMQKLGVKGRSQAVIELIRLGELEI